MTEDEIWFWLCSAKGIYQDAIGRLLAAFGSVKEIYDRDMSGLIKSGLIRKDQAKSLIDEKAKGDFRFKYEKMKKAGIDFVHFESESFPEKLKTIPAHPYCLYVKGRLPDPNLPSCAIVGARACSEYGKKEAVAFSSFLAENGVQIISGMASGIDSIAQNAALDSGGMTFAVLGGGVDVIYPAENTVLYYRIIEEGGGIISEYPPGCAPLAWQFPHRNRIISGLADKLLIMEARKRSGTLSTARHALDQGRDIYALPGRITDPLSAGCNELIYDGAGILTDPSYILNDFFSGSEAGDRPLLCKDSGSASDESFDETGLLKYLSFHAQRLDDIAKRAGLDIEETAVKLALLELYGRAKEVGKDFYVRI